MLTSTTDYNPETGFDANNVGAVRFGRAAAAVGRIGFDYKKTLGAFKDVRALEDDATDNDTGRSQEYVDALSACHLRSADKLLKLCQVGEILLVHYLLSQLIQNDLLFPG